MIAIVDYGAGNIRSVVNAVSKLGYHRDLVNRPGKIEYGLNFCSILAKGNLVATQFHPEKGL